MTDTSSSETGSDLWHVEVGPGDVRVVNLEQLDDAFQRDVINVDTRVWQEGLPHAIRLGDLLGGDSDDDAEEDYGESVAAQGRMTPAPSSPSNEPPLPRDTQHTLIGLSPPPPRSIAHYRTSPIPAAGRPPEPEPAPASYQRPAAPQQPAPVVAYQHPTAPHQPAPAAYQQPAPAVHPQVPRAAQFPPTPGMSPVPAQPMTHSAPPTTGQPSIAPLAVDVGDEFAFARPNRVKQVAVALGGLAAIAAGIALAVNASGTSSSDEEAPAAAAAQPQPFKGRPYDPGSGSANADDSTSTRTHALTRRDPSAKDDGPKSKKRSSWKPTKAKSASGDPFEKKGKAHAYDPLNASLR